MKSPFGSILRASVVLLVMLACQKIPNSAAPFQNLPSGTPISGDELIQPVPSTVSEDGENQVEHFVPTSLPPIESTRSLPVQTHLHPGYMPYYTQPGDTIISLAARFKVDTDEILPGDGVPAPASLLDPGATLWLPAAAMVFPQDQYLLPDIAMIDGPGSAGFDTATFIMYAGGFLSIYNEYLKDTGTTSAAEVILRVSLENSVNPRLLLAVLEHECQCVYNELDLKTDADHLFGLDDFRFRGLYLPLTWAAGQLNAGYYRWRDGSLVFRSDQNGIITPFAPVLNAGTVALRYYAVQRLNLEKTLNSENVTSSDIDEQKIAADIASIYRQMFGDPWEHALSQTTNLSGSLRQPVMGLPFQMQIVWALTAGPHPAWGQQGSLAALDFAPAALSTGCDPTDAWVVAVADGLVVRSASGAVVQDLGDSVQGESSPDGLEQTGWVVLYLHIAQDDRVPNGTFLHQGDLIGHPSCEGGSATGTHLHIARKYNGEWIAAGGPLPLILDGWTTHAGAAPYLGSLTKGEHTVIADVNSSKPSQIIRSND